MAHQRVKLLQFAVLMVRTMCRVGELLNLPYRDRSIDPKTKVLTAGTGKRGTSTIKAPASAGKLVALRLAYLGKNPDLSLRIFPTHHREGFNELLKALISTATTQASRAI